MLHQPAFGRRLRKLRQARGLSQTAVAGDGMSTGYLSRLESGARQPTERAVAYLAERLGLEPSDFEEPAGGSLANALTLVASTGSDTATETLREALAAEGHEAPVLRWQALWQLARQRRVQGDLVGEREDLEELVRLGDMVGLVVLRVRGLTRLARCLRSLGEIGAALDAALTAHQLAREEDLEVEDRAAVLLALVSVEAEAGRMPDAEAHVAELVKLLEGRSDTLWAEAMWTAAVVRQRRGDDATARDHLKEALERFGSDEDLLLWVRLRIAAGRLYVLTQPPDVEAADRCVKEAESALPFVGGPGLRHDLIAIKADIAFLAGRYAEAQSLVDELDEVEHTMAYRDRVRLEMVRQQLRILSGDESGVQGLRALAQQAQADANVDLAAQIWQILAESLAQAAKPGSAAQGA